jgi:phosphonopyruvate decarboxylase
VIRADEFLDAARARGFDFYTGVPCSFLTPLINRVIGARDLDYVGAASEGEAVAIAAGAWLAGRKTVVMCQNSGLGNAVNPLTSLNFPFRIPTMLIVTWRGQPGLKDEPQHELMGQITGELLDTIRVARADFPGESAVIPAAIARAEVEIGQDRSFAFVMANGSVGEEALDQPPPRQHERGRREDFADGGLPRRAAVLERVLSAIPESAGIVATTGKCGRELFTLSDRKQHLYQVGSMGCASGMGLGVALNTNRKIVILDGDGAALMKLGTMATIGASAPDNLIHVVLDNGVHDSTGGQATVSWSVDFADVALACGYRYAARCEGAAGFEAGFRAALATTGPALLHASIAAGSMEKLGRPTISPPQVARRFRDFLAKG